MLRKSRLKQKNGFLRKTKCAVKTKPYHKGFWVLPIIISIIFFANFQKGTTRIIVFFPKISTFFQISFRVKFTNHHFCIRNRLKLAKFTE